MNKEEKMKALDKKSRNFITREVTEKNQILFDENKKLKKEKPEMSMKEFIKSMKFLMMYRNIDKGNKLFIKKA